MPMVSGPAQRKQSQIYQVVASHLAKSKKTCGEEFLINDESVEIDEYTDISTN